MVQFMWRVAFFCVLCLLANYMFFFSLRILDATVVMALFSCSVSLIYLLSWVVLHQQFVGIRVSWWARVTICHPCQCVLTVTD